MLTITFWLATLVASVLGATYTNPVLWEDLADVEVIRVNDTYYYTASTMHYSPGAPVLRSYDLVNWEFIGHSVPVLDWSAKYSMTSGQTAYVKGIWASSLKYRKSNGLFYWVGCIEFGTSYVYTASNPAGPWSKHATINTCFYDAGLLIDDNDTIYIAYGSTTINVAQLNADATAVVKTQAVFSSTAIGYIEGSRFLKINGKYYIFVTKPANEEHVLQATSPFGTYTTKPLVKSIAAPVSGAGNPHQGGLVDTPAGKWYYMAFIDNYPGGRTPVLAPVTWGSDGFPTITAVNGGWGATYDYPVTQHTVASPVGTDSFSGTSLSHQWEWNHNPDTSAFSVNNGLTLKTATVTTDLYKARNTLTHRIIGPASVATILLNYSAMKSGDRAGLAMFRDQSAWIGIINNSGTFRLSVQAGINQDQSTWATTSTGSETAGLNLALGGTQIWLRVEANISPGTGKQAKFSYSTDGNTFTSFGAAFTMTNDWHYFIGYRFGIFNFATSSLGGSVGVKCFDMNFSGMGAACGK